SVTCTVAPTRCCVSGSSRVHPSPRLPSMKAWGRPSLMNTRTRVTSTLPTEGATWDGAVGTPPGPPADGEPPEPQAAVATASHTHTPNLCNTRHLTHDDRQAFRRNARATPTPVHLRPGTSG